MLCPICKKPVQITDPFMPFCSDRCRVQDLANWSDEKYTISGSANIEQQENLPPMEDEDD